MAPWPIYGKSPEGSRFRYSPDMTGFGSSDSSTHTPKPPCEGVAGFSWGSIGVILGFSWGSIGDILGLYWGLYWVNGKRMETLNPKPYIS